MANLDKPTTTDSTTAKSGTDADNAVGLLTRDHEKVKQLLRDFEQLRKEKAAGNRRRELVSQICNELKVHTQLEEEIFYPTVRSALEQEELIEEARVEHMSARSLIKHIEGMDPNDELYDATVTVLGEYVKHHINEEEKELFPQVESSGLDLQQMGAEMKNRKEELKTKLH